jgi:ABC-2 type transport system permease protein
MNSTEAFAASDGPAGVTPPPPAAPASRMLATLVRREFWEHRSLWIAPLAVAALVAVSAFWIHADFDSHDVERGWAPSQGRNAVTLFTLAQGALSVPLYLAMLFVLFFYAIDCLYAERKDRSILFWKSMPVSDGMTVTSKALTALVVVPLGVFVLAAVTAALFVLFFDVRGSVSGTPIILSWDTLEWLRAQAAMLLLLVAALLWYAPAVAALMLLSAWSRRNPFVWLTVPALAPLLEYMIFRTHYIWSFYRYRRFGIWEALGLGHTNIVTKHGIHPFGDLLGATNWGGAFLNADLWLGVVVAVALFFAAARIRRYRDDT